MCDPVSATLAILAVTTTAVGIVQQVKASKNQEKALAAQLDVSVDEINDKSSAQKNDRLREMRREQARIKVTAGEAGLQLGGSIEGLLGDSLMQAGLSNERISQNRENELNNVHAEANSAYSRVKQTGALEAGLQLASAGVEGYSQGQSLKIAQR